ncbi:hypothetical protein V9J15_02790 [Candidatus Liberibacter africanus]|uniref:Uncharacterized protein n=1 Tax=Candidatus Liberibacter africanus PTSAPSY TaxID=1277257 RepID=A0A0G3I898_LIBAF|nr:hypothetical protein [Candidatus Liberibacter africanus]AKK19932.1 hypothetical protein G293_01500 [Candidatus Liberibacter africanus PTSAPSY]
MLYLNWFDILIITLLCVTFGINFKYLFSLIGDIIKYLQNGMRSAFFAIFKKNNTTSSNQNFKKKIILKKKSIKKEQLSDLNPQNNKKDKNRSKNASPIKRKENIVSSSKPNPNHNDFDK